MQNMCSRLLLVSDHVMTSSDYDTDSIGWNRNIVIMSPKKERPDTMVVDKPEDDIPHVSTTPSLVNEENTPILLNAVAGIFFPICHTQACTSHQMTEETLRQLLVWQNKFFQVQVLIFNSCILGVVCTIYFLVSSVPSFNYNYNVLDFFWFQTASMLLVLMAVLSFVMSLETKVTMTIERILHCVGRGEERRKSGEDLYRKTYLCMLATLLVLMPAILAVVLFHVSPVSQPLLLVAREGEERRELVVVGTTVPPGFPYMYPGQGRMVEPGELTNDCNLTQPLQVQVLVVNLTESRCHYLMEDQLVLESVVGHSSNLSMILILDSVGPVGWRVSSPHSRLGILARVVREHVMVLLVRRQDWTGLEDHMVTGRKLRVLSGSQDLDMGELDMFPCMLHTHLSLRVEPDVQEETETHTQWGTLLHRDGSITQQLKVTVSCTFYGESVCRRWGINQIQTWRTQCKNVRNVDVQLYFGKDEENIIHPVS